MKNQIMSLSDNVEDEEFRNFLGEKYSNYGTISSRMSNYSTIKKYEGSLYNSYELDKCKSLLERFQLVNGKAQHSIPIEGNIKNGTATYRSAVNLYIEFRKSQETNELNENVNIGNLNVDSEVKNVETVPVNISKSKNKGKTIGDVLNTIIRTILSKLKKTQETNELNENANAKNTNVNSEVKNSEEFSVNIPRSRTNVRYKGKAIGDGQNAIIRAILSKLGDESFGEKDWEETKIFFNHRCAYCDCDTDHLEMDHAIPLNKDRLGEHRLGNLVPACRNCNSKKGSKDYISFLGDNVQAINRIEEYMALKNYVPLLYNENLSAKLKLELEAIHKEIRVSTDRNIERLNSLYFENE
ncbi:MAG: HNH endonuclease [Oscillospiraceae bacterium]|jgi:5-methylcytosine-specific restriction endonuclease McrA|nr:HNH endonuclease [Oscillospiraceae bacterium]